MGVETSFVVAMRILADRKRPCLTYEACERRSRSAEKSFASFRSLHPGITAVGTSGRTRRSIAVKRHTIRFGIDFETKRVPHEVMGKKKGVFGSVVPRGNPVMYCERPS